VLAEVNGWDADGQPLSTFYQLKSDGSTTCGCWIYCGVRAGGVNQAARRTPGREQNWVAGQWGWAWPANRRILYNRASADPDGKPWSERKAYVWWDEAQGKWTGHDVPDFIPDRPPSYRPPAGSTGVAAIAGTDPFIMQADGKAWLFTPAGLVDGPLPAHYEPQESPLPNALYGQQHNPVREMIADPENRFQPSGSEPGSGVFPYVTTTYRLTEHHTAGGMSRFLPYLSELQPAFFCEVSPELAAERGLEHLGWATIISARNAIEARVLVTRRIKPLRAGGQPVHQIGLPWHWGPNGLTTGDAANELSHLALDPNVHIQEVKAMAVDIQPGRRPRGPELRDLIRSYQERAGITDETGRQV
jgi:formate dehydrogenase major subunit